MTSHPNDDFVDRFTTKLRNVALCQAMAIALFGEQIGGGHDCDGVLLFDDDMCAAMCVEWVLCAAFPKPMLGILAASEGENALVVPEERVSLTIPRDLDVEAVCTSNLTAEHGDEFADVVCIVLGQHTVHKGLRGERWV